MMVHVPEDGQRRTLTVYLFQCTKEPSLGERWPGIPDGANAPSAITWRRRCTNVALRFD
jgi:hypothetical protein